MAYELNEATMRGATDAELKTAIQTLKAEVLRRQQERAAVKYVAEHLPTEIKTTKVSVEYRRGKKEIFGRDLVDRLNEPAFYTTSKRGLDKAWAALVQTEKGVTEMSLSDVMRVLTEHGVRYHYWCMVD